LHGHERDGRLSGFVMPYLGQQDRELSGAPADLVRRDAVAGYPTNFAAMSDHDFELLTRRGEQLTRYLIERWCPDLT
jgi:NTE family protein